MRVLLLFLIITSNSIAQTEGYIKYTIFVEAQDTSAEMINGAMLLRDSKMEIYYTKDHYRVDYKAGALYVMNTIYNKDQAQIITLTTNHYGKFGQIKDISETEKLNDLVDTNTVINTYRDSTKKILGFNCYYVEILENGTVTKYWVTDEINSKVGSQSIVNPMLSGFPLWFSKKANGIKMTYTASNFRDELTNSESIFITNLPEGYQLVISN